ncbi:MAG: hypothetical protein ACOY9J_13165 [Pseudomonadota bacterium]
MAQYRVALWIEVGGRESREDIHVQASNRTEAVSEAQERLPRGATVKKVIDVEQVG